jgi:RNA polymerase sigma-70 factor, ECF subfamily
MPDESELAQLARSGDPDTFAQALEPYLPMLFAYSRALCGDYHAAQDVVQETALIAFRKRHLFFPEADFGTWLRAIARREALAARRKLSRHPCILDETIERVYEEPTPAADTERGLALAQCLQVLSARMGQALRAHYFQGLRLAELAARLEMSTAAVKQMLYRARLTLEACVRKRLSLKGTS